MGLLAGTAVNLLTLLWGSSVLFSRHDLEESADSTNTKRFSFLVFSHTSHSKALYENVCGRACKFSLKICLLFFNELRENVQACFQYLAVN